MIAIFIFLLSGAALILLIGLPALILGRVIGLVINLATRRK